jgi:hypothetical protein
VQPACIEQLETDDYLVRAQRLDELESVDNDEWLDLEARSIEGNCFLSPCFVIPAARYLAPTRDIIVIRIWEKAPRRLIALGVFEIRGPTLRRPMSCLMAFRTVHTFNTGMLVDKASALAALRSFVQFVSQPGQPWNAVEFVDLNVNAPFGAAFVEFVGSGTDGWCERESYRRAMLLLDATLPVDRLASGYKRDMNRVRRRLQDAGELRGCERDEEAARPAVDVDER